ncbi:sensor histidine kinase [Neobacillus drentensis]|uniref:sensor histidine kinase n=1 Tax=Neobacillus drentensis TaxID=220684 RepID=UPI00082548AA|nr:sensor histidine kinase [Neobacillus drentensis]
MKTQMIQQALSLSFRYKVLLIAITCLILPTLSTFTVYNYLTKDAVKEQAVISSQNELKLTDEYIKSVFQDMLYTLNFIQIDTELNAILKYNNQMNTVNRGIQYEEFLNDQNVQQKLDTITLIGQKSYVTILLNNGKFYTNYSNSEFNPLILKNEPWFQFLSNLKGYSSIWIAPQPAMIASERKNNSFQLSVARPLRDSNSGIYGYAMVTIMEDRIIDILSNDSTDHGMVLLNEKGKIIAKNKHLEGILTENINQKIMNNTADVINIEGEEYLINERELSITGWKLISLNPYENAISRINSIFNQVFIVQTATFLVFLVLLVYLLRKILNRLNDLRNLAAKVQKGDLSVRSKVKGKDEIAVLSRSFNLMLDKVNQVIEENTLTQSRKRKAELAMLQAQINPHFLFNVLNSIRMKVLLKRDHDSAEMISSLSKLLRITIDKHKGMIPFQEEIEINHDFVRIMNMRQRHKVELKVEVSPEALSIEIPRLVLQPIIENAIIHGFSDHEGYIILKANYLEDYLLIEIIDNGNGMVKDQLTKIRETIDKTGSEGENFESEQRNSFSSIGLSNVNERMKLTFGEDFIMQVHSALDKGTRVSMYIPMKKEIKHVSSDVSR